MTTSRTLSTPTVGRYLLDPASREPRGAPILVGFHGYAQNADILLQELKGIPGAELWTFIAVQALHRFYNTKTQEVVGSWMTSQDRDQAIADNLAYVTRVIAQLRAEGHTGKLVFAGFSQGAAMAWRAAAHLPCQGLLVLGGDLPKDVAEAPVLKLPPILIGRGERDTFYSEVHLEKDLATLERLGQRVEVLRFEGGHEWGPDFLMAAGRFLAGLKDS